MPIDLIAGIENHIHIEVKKLYEDAELPTFNLVEKKEDSLTIIYTSTRGLNLFCYWAYERDLTIF